MFTGRRQAMIIRDRGLAWTDADGGYGWEGQPIWSCCGGRWRLVRLQPVRGSVEVRGQVIARRYVNRQGHYPDGSWHKEYRLLGIDDGVRDWRLQVDRATYESAAGGTWVRARKDRFAGLRRVAVLRERQPGEQRASDS